MGKAIDLTGRRFGKLTVIERSESKRGYTTWKCLCDCGNEVDVRGGNLQSGNTKSCGCKKRGALLHDLTGKRFGVLTVIHRVENKNGETIWRCKCDCGKETNVYAKNLVRGYTKSCGCKQGDFLSETNKIDISGKRFGKITVLKMIPNTRGDSRFECLCDCGNKVVIVGRELKTGHTKSCGCTHSSSDGLSRDRIYREWLNMRQRCNNENHISYKDYGGRGICVCKEWNENFLAFHRWAMSNGYSDDLTIERKDVNGNYEPSNCCWITQKQQQRNRRDNVFITYKGTKHTAVEWAEITGIPQNTITRRKRNGWSDEECIEIPPYRRRRKRKS